MSNEDTKINKKNVWTGLELRGPIKNLSPVLWTFTHLTTLYLNDNNLQRIPPDIVNLCNLSHLDLSGNKLRSLPVELGDMTHLRELLLNNNSLRILPCELGRLFLLQTLGITGNPLSPDVLVMANEPQGTSKLLAFLLENLTVCHRPPDREWIPISPMSYSRESFTFTVLSYNVLCDNYLTPSRFGYCPRWAQLWDYRKDMILKEMIQMSADIIALQEVETDQYYTFFLPELKRAGYDGVFSPKSRAKTMGEMERKNVDGCAIFFNKLK
jgi:CCR4-NOT transcription complex subunit 6